VVVATAASINFTWGKFFAGEETSVTPSVTAATYLGGGKTSKATDKQTNRQTNRWTTPLHCQAVTYTKTEIVVIFCHHKKLGCHRETA